MAENSKIEWTDHTFNPWVGCTKVSPACDHCYAESWAKRGGTPELWAGERRRTTAANWRLPLKWNREAAEKGVRYRVFCASLADVFDNAVPALWRTELLDLIRWTPNLDWLLLTKRIGNAKTMLPRYDGEFWKNVWLGITVVNQEEADRDIPKLLATPARVRFLSMEPLLGPVDLDHYIGEAICASTFRSPGEGFRRCDLTGAPCESIDWVIVGGESGPGARPMHPEWARSLRDQCAAAGVPFFFKQWGDWRPPILGVEKFNTGKGINGRPPAYLLDMQGHVHCFYNSAGENPTPVLRVGKKAAGRTLDGRTHDEYPGEDV